MTAPEGLDRAARRPSLSLDGWWSFVFDGATEPPGGDCRPILSPGIWQAQFPSLRNERGAGRYRRRIEIPADWAGRRIVLILEGIFHESTILVDEAAVAAHGDGWTPIEVDLTDVLAGRSSFALGIDARAPDDRDGGRFSLSLAGKQDWYGFHGGIWKPARLEARDPVHIAEMSTQAAFDLRDGVVVCKGRVAAPGRLRLTLRRAGAILAREEFDLDSTEFHSRLAVARPQPWSPDEPNLYELAAELLRDGAPVDALARTIGFRRFEAKNGELLLNGAPFFMRGALDQDWHPETECRAPSAAFLEERFRNAKAMGLNTLRCHVKIPDRLYFDLADRLGLVVWLDMPYAEFLAPTTRSALWATFRGAVAEHAHHPALCVWALFNEGWGIDLDDNPDDRRWLIETFDAAKRLVPESLVVDNSPCFPRNYHLKTDIEDFHWYNGFPNQNEAFAATARAFAAGASWAWSPHGDAQKRGGEPRVCSEFGIWGLPHPRQIAEADGREPWWFESGHDWNEGAAYPHGIETRFRDAGLAPLFGDLDGFIAAAQELQGRALKQQIETLRWQPEIAGYVITELNDTQWESNGLMDVGNRPRAFARRLAELQTPWLVVARTARTAIGVGERFEVAVRLTGAGPPPDGAKLVWRFAGQGGAAPITGQPTTIVLTAGAGETIAVAPLELEARDRNNRLLSGNALEFCIAPPLRRAPSLFALDEAARRMLAALRWPNRAASPREADAVLATRLTTPVREALLAGRKTLLIANAPDALVDPQRALPLSDRHNFPSMLLRPREGTPRDGQWMGAFCWRRMDGAWAGLPNGPLLDEHWTGLLPRYVLTGFPSSAFAGLVDAGMAVGWLHLAAAFSKRSLLGAAWLTVTTFDLLSDAAARNPLAPHLLAALAVS